MKKLTTTGIASLDKNLTEQFRAVFKLDEAIKSNSFEKEMKHLTAKLQSVGKSLRDMNYMKATITPNRSKYDENTLNTPDSVAYKTMDNYEDSERLAKLGIKKSPNYKSSFFKLNSFLTTFINKMETYDLTTMQLRVLSYVSFQSELELREEQLTITKIAENLGVKFTTVQRCVEKLGSGYEYNRDGKTKRIDGCGFLKNDKPDGGREGAISITSKGKKFLEGIAELVSGYGAKDQTPFILTTTLQNNLSNLQQMHGLAELARLGIEQGLFDKYLKGKEK